MVSVVSVSVGVFAGEQVVAFAVVVAGQEAVEPEYVVAESAVAVEQVVVEPEYVAAEPAIVAAEQAVAACFVRLVD